MTFSGFAEVRAERSAGEEERYLGGAERFTGTSRADVASRPTRTPRHRPPGGAEKPAQAPIQRSSILVPRVAGRPEAHVRAVGSG